MYELTQTPLGSCRQIIWDVRAGFSDAHAPFGSHLPASGPKCCALTHPASWPFAPARFPSEVDRDAEIER
jgi:hypothetical protein